MHLRHQLADGSGALATHARAHAATGKRLGLIGPHTATCRNAADLPRGNLFAATDDGIVIERQLKLRGRRKVSIQKTPQTALAFQHRGLRQRLCTTNAAQLPEYFMGDPLTLQHGHLGTCNTHRVSHHGYGFAASHTNTPDVRNPTSLERIKMVRNTC